MENINNFDYIIVGAGFAGLTAAERLASKKHKILLIDKRNHLGGNAYDYFDENGIIIHKYGPHIFHTNNKEVWEYLKCFSSYFPYKHKVLGNLRNELVPVPFNYKSLELTHNPKECNKIKKAINIEYPNQEKIFITDLLNSKSAILKKFGNFVYKNVFEYYTSKQWGVSPKEIDKSVINRVPVVLSYKDTYFSDAYQYMPSKGYNDIFKNMVKSKNIKIMLNTNTVDHISFKNNKIYIDKEEFKGKIIYSGAIDELFKYKYGLLPYRSLDIKLETINKTHYQKAATINYLTSEKFTRISEYKYFLKQNIKNKTVIAKEFSKPYSLDSNTDPYYPINNDINNTIYLKYKKLADKYRIQLLGRLAEYKYYNMDAVIARALELFNK